LSARPSGPLAVFARSGRARPVVFWSGVSFPSCVRAVFAAIAPGRAPHASDALAWLGRLLVTPCVFAGTIAQTVTTGCALRGLFNGRGLRHRAALPQLGYLEHQYPVVSLATPDNQRLVRRACHDSSGAAAVYRRAITHLRRTRLPAAPAGRLVCSWTIPRRSPEPLRRPLSQLSIQEAPDRCAARRRSRCAATAAAAVYPGAAVTRVFTMLWP